MASLGIAILGCGTVGGSVVKVLQEQSARIAKRAGRSLELRHIMVRDAKKSRCVELPQELLAANLDRVFSDPKVDVVVEVAGGVTWAKDAVLGALAAGKHVVTANK